MPQTVGVGEDCMGVGRPGFLPLYLCNTYTGRRIFVAYGTQYAVQYAVPYEGGGLELLAATGQVH